MARKKTRTARKSTTTARKASATRKTTKPRRATAKPRKAATRGRAASPKASSNGEASKLKMNQIMLLKTRAKTSNNSLSVRIGAARFSLPVETTYLVGEGVAFCQVKGGSAIYKIDKASKRFVHVGASEANTAYKSLLQAGRDAKRGGRGNQVDEATQSLMRSLEAKLRSQGLKPAIDLKTGVLRAAKPRKR